MLQSFERFVKERKYLTNVSPATIYWYHASWKCWQKYEPDFLMNAREAGVTPATIDCYLRALNAYFRWADLPTIPKLKQEEKILGVFSAQDIRTIATFKTTFRTLAVHLICLVLLDTGLRIN